MRSHTSYSFGEYITREWSEFEGTKLEFMNSIPNVSADIRKECLDGEEYHYCCVFGFGKLYEVFSWGDSHIWNCKY